MFDISLDLTKFFMLWAVAFLIGFSLPIILTFVFKKKLKGRSIILAVICGITLLVMAMYGLFDGFLPQ